MKISNVKFLRSTKLLVSILIAATFLIYFQSFYSELIFLDDDLLVYERFQDTNLESKISNAFTSNYLGGHYYRPVTLLSFAIDSELAGSSLFIYHFSNFLIHLITVLVLFITLKEIGYSQIVAFISSMFFALNPININAIGWIAGRGDLMTALFTLLGLFFFHKYINRNQPSFLLAVIVALLLAILSKEAAMLAPFLFVVFLLIERKIFTLDKKNFAALLMIPIVLISYYTLRGLLSDVHIDKFSFTTFFNNILVLPETISKFFIPAGIKALPGIEPLTSISGIIILLVLVILPLTYKKINQLRYYFGLIWFMLLLLPGMVFRTMVQDGFFYWDCRSYLPLVGLIIIIAELLRPVELSNSYKLYSYMAAIYLIIFALSSYKMIKIYNNAYSYWNKVKSEHPISLLPYVGLFNYNSHQGNLVEAENQLSKGIKIRPEEASIREMQINFYLNHGQKKKALIAAKDATESVQSRQDFFINKITTLSIEIDQGKEVDNLIMKYGREKGISTLIKVSIENELEKLVQNSEIEQVEILKSKLFKLQTEIKGD